MPSVKMTEVGKLASEIMSNPDYNLESYGLDISAIIDCAVEEQMPKHYNELDQQNFELELRGRLETAYDKLEYTNSYSNYNSE